MKDYVLTGTRTDGKVIRLEFDSLADAETVMEWAKPNIRNESLEIRGMGYPLAWFRRDGCQVCEGHGRITDWDNTGNVMGFEDCWRCEGTGVAQGDYSRGNEPPEAGEVPCPDCQPVSEPELIAASEYAPHDISDLVL